MLLTKRKSTFNCIYIKYNMREREIPSTVHIITYILQLPTGFSSGAQKAENFPHLIMKINSLPIRILSHIQISQGLNDQNSLVPKHKIIYILKPRGVVSPQLRR